MINSVLKAKNHEGVHRAYTIEDFTELLFDRKFLNVLGITRLAVTTGLDKVGIPTASATFPNSEDSISIYSGKGLTRNASKISAVMEAIERVSATHRNIYSILTTENELKMQNINYVRCADFTELADSNYNEDFCIEWTEGYDLNSKTYVKVPLSQVITPYKPLDGKVFSPFRVTHTNGLSAGFCLEEAICQGICEIIERDAVSLAELRSSIFPFEFIKRLTDFIDDKEMETPAYEFADDYELYKSVAPSSLPEICKELLEKFVKSGLDVTIKYIPSDIGIPTFGCVCFEEVSDQKAMFRAGYGTHPDKTTALIRALTELAQSRVVDIQGGREDLHTLDKRRTKNKIPPHWLYTNSSQMVDFNDIKNYYFEDLLDEINFMVESLQSVGLDRVIVVPLKSILPGSFVVRIIIPGIETWHPTGGASKLGKRGIQFAMEQNIII